VSSASPHTQQLIDEELGRVVDEARADVTQLLSEHREQLERRGRALLEAETLEADAAYAAAGFQLPSADQIGSAGVLQGAGTEV
jgi:cell division protease FtsH